MVYSCCHFKMTIAIHMQKQLIAALYHCKVKHFFQDYYV